MSYGDTVFATFSFGVLLLHSGNSNVEISKIMPEHATTEIFQCENSLISAKQKGNSINIEAGSQPPTYDERRVSEMTSELFRELFSRRSSQK